MDSKQSDRPDHERRRILAASLGLAAISIADAEAVTRNSMKSTSEETAASDDEITPAVIAGAERLAGIRFSEEERRIIAETIGEQVSIFASRVRAGDMPNSLAPALVFRAMLPGRSLNPATPAGDPTRIVGDVGPLPESDADIAFAPVTRLATWIRRDRLTSERLTRIYLSRIERLGPELRCMITTTADRALAQAKAADRELAGGRDRGPLHGIPYGAKDIIDVEGVPATWGAEPFRDRVAEETASVIERLDANGAVMLGKTSVGALAYGDLWFGGRTLNPWDRNQGSSGSSAGSASGTAAGLMAFALGTETYGSIVSPSIRCVTTGLRPTFGRVPKSGVMSLCWSLDKIGPICRSVNDTALVLAAINGEDPHDPSSVDQPFTYAPDQDVRGLRIGWNSAWFQNASEDQRRTVEHLRSSGCEIVEVEIPDLPYESLLITLYAEAAAAFESLTRSDLDDALSWQDPEAWPNTFRRSWFIPAVEAVQADRVRREAMRAMAGIMDSVDALITPPFAANLLLITNATGHPSLVQPVGFDDRRCPEGITLIGRLFDEGTLCRIGRCLETSFGIARRRPPGT